MRTPVHVVGGYLGTGKTTVLLAELRRREGKERCAVVVNDFGEAAVDAMLLGDGVRVTNIPGGCVCCTAPEGLAPAILAILDEIRPDRIFIEPSGLARPRDIVDMLGRGPVAARIERMPTIVLVDPARNHHDQALLGEQLDGADVLVANRCDLADFDQLASFDKLAKSLWPAPILAHRTTRGVLPEAAFCWPVGAGPLADRDGNQCEPDDDSGHHHGHSGTPFVDAHDPDDGHGKPSTAGFTARSWIFPPTVVFAWDRLVPLLANSPGIERFKGVFRADVGWYRLDVASGLVQPASTAFRRDSRADLVVREGFDLEAFQLGLLGARLGEREVNAWDSVALTLVDPEGNEFPLTRGALSALPGQVPDVSTRFPTRQGAGVALGEVLALGGGTHFVLIASDGLTTEPQPIAQAGGVVVVHSLAGDALPDALGGPFRVHAPAATSCANVKALLRIRLLAE